MRQEAPSLRGCELGSLLWSLAYNRASASRETGLQTYQQSTSSVKQEPAQRSKGGTVLSSASTRIQLKPVPTAFLNFSIAPYSSEHETGENEGRV